MAVSRGKYLVVVIGDMSTLCDGALPAFDKMSRTAREGANGARYERFAPDDDVSFPAGGTNMHLAGNMRPRTFTLK